MGVPRGLRRILVAAVAAGLPLTVSLPAQAADSIDQKQLIASGANTLHTPMAQTFTAAVSGSIDRVTIDMATLSGAISVNLQIQSVTGGKPNGNVLGSSSFTGALNSATWKDFVFPAGVAVTAGTQYAIVAYPSGWLTWYDARTADTFSKGQMWLYSAGTWIYQTSFGKDFTFEEWLVSGNSNQAPTVSANSPSITFPEGSNATNTGTYSDPDGDNVALSASSGTLTKTGTSSGTWTWSQSSADESPAQQVTITANDGRGSSTQVMFNVTITPAPPTVTIVGAPSSGPEGTGITLTAKAVSPSAADNAVGFNYTWAVAKNGSQPSAAVTGSSFTLTPDDEGSFVVTLTATDDGGNGASVSATVTGINVAPTAKIASVTHLGLVVVAYTPITFDGGFTDPGALDTHTSTFDYGDGSTPDTGTYPASGSGDTTDTYAYSKPGTYTVSYTVSDDDGGTSTTTATVTVETPAQALGVIDAYTSKLSGENGLLAKYRAAEASLARGDTKTTCNQLDAALNDLSAQTKNGSLSPSDSGALGTATLSVHRALGCTKMKVAWLTLSV